LLGVERQLSHRASWGGHLWHKRKAYGAPQADKTREGNTFSDL